MLSELRVVGEGHALITSHRGAFDDEPASETVAELADETATVAEE
jgi:hypothetical protein